MARKSVSEAVDLARIAERQNYIRLAVDTTVKLLGNPLISGLAGYVAISAASKIKDDKGRPYMGENASAILKGVAAGYPLGGYAGLAVGTTLALSESTLSGATIGPIKTPDKWYEWFTTGLWGGLTK